MRFGGSPYVTDVEVEHHAAVLNGESASLESRVTRLAFWLAAGSRSGEPQGAGGDWDRAGPSAGDGFLPPGPAPPPLLPPHPTLVPIRSEKRRGSSGAKARRAIASPPGAPQKARPEAPLWRSLGWNARSTSSRQVRRSSPSERSAKRARGSRPSRCASSGRVPPPANGSWNAGSVCRSNNSAARG